jgi:hypothetical protein
MAPENAKSSVLVIQSSVLVEAGNGLHLLLPPDFKANTYIKNFLT